MRHGRPRSSLSAAAAIVMAAVVTVGCSPLVDPSTELDASTAATPVAASASDAPAPTALDEVQVSAEVYRTRSDPARGGIQLTVHNQGSTTLTIVSARLASPVLASPVVRDRRTVVAPGQSRDLAMTLGSASCPAEPVSPHGVLEVVLVDGTVVELKLPTTDRLGQWAAWVRQECFSAAVRERLELSIAREPSLDGNGTIGLVLNVEGRTGAEHVTITGVRGTVLLSLVADERDASRVDGVAAGDPIARRSLDVVLDEGLSASIPITVAPTRCDPHALADDKQGTLIPVDVVLASEGDASLPSAESTTSGIVIVAADPSTKAALYEAIATACELS